MASYMVLYGMKGIESIILMFEKGFETNILGFIYCIFLSMYETMARSKAPTTLQSFVVKFPSPLKT